MELNKKCKVYFGHYSASPREGDVAEINFPEDTLFFTGGTNDIGPGLYKGACHVLAMTKASDEELEKVHKQYFKANVVTISGYALQEIRDKVFRVNGYAFIELPDCESDDFEFTDVDKINDLLDLKNHPVYVLLLNDDYMISNITRIDRINSSYNVETVTIQLYSQIGSRYYPLIHTKSTDELWKLLHPFYKFFGCVLEEDYGKELIDELLYTALGEIYPEYKKKLKGYDLENIHKVYSQLNTPWLEVLDNLLNEENNKGLTNFFVDSKPQIDNVEALLKKLPLKNE